MDGFFAGFVGIVEVVVVLFEAEQDAEMSINAAANTHSMVIV
jgi:hypothetical protein